MYTQASFSVILIFSKNTYLKLLGQIQTASLSFWLLFID